MAFSLITGSCYMKKVLVFFNSKPAILQTVVKGVTVIKREYNCGGEAHLKIMFAGIHLITGPHIEFYVASDRELTSCEITEAANTLL